ncbi:MAG: hypothetical protein H2066_03945 [Candidatus Poseidoniales archaeon]|nr:hypothetical protein [Candidatus Poseidoniales archaeon]
MDWVEVETPGPGPKMLWPMAWSLLPLVGGLLLLLRDGSLLATSFLAMGIMLSLIAVWIGTTNMPGRVDMLVLLVSPFGAFILFFQPPEIIQAIIALIIWTINYRTAAFLSALSGKSYRCKWDPRVPLPEVDGATYLHRKWAARPLFRIGSNVVRGIRVGSDIMLESDTPITFTFSDE